MAKAKRVLKWQRDPEGMRLRILKAAKQEFATHGLADRVLVMTERPGAIAAIYDVPLPRPRSPDAMADPVFTELVQRNRAHFFTQSTLD